MLILIGDTSRKYTRPEIEKIYEIWYNTPYVNKHREIFLGIFTTDYIHVR